MTDLSSVSTSDLRAVLEERERAAADAGHRRPLLDGLQVNLERRGWAFSQPVDGEWRDILPSGDPRKPAGNHTGNLGISIRREARTREALLQACLDFEEEQARRPVSLRSRAIPSSHPLATDVPEAQDAHTQGLPMGAPLGRRIPSNRPGPDRGHIVPLQKET